MNWDGRWVKPDKRKGKLVLLNGDDDLMYVRWHDREKPPTADPEMNLVVVNDVYLEKIDKCTTGRVYLLRFTSSPDKKEFFWMQEPKDDGDADLVKKFNDSVGATIPAAGAAAPAGTAATPGAGTPTPPVDPQLAGILQQFLAQGGAQQERKPPVPLGAVLTTEVLQTLLTDDAAMTEMASLMPEGQRTPEDIRETLASPQLQQSLSSLTQAVHSDQLPVLFAGLGLDASSLATLPPGTDALEALCRAMEAHASSTPPQ